MMGTVANPCFRKLQKRKLEAQHFRSEKSRAHHLCPAQYALLQKTRALISGDGVIGLRRLDQVKQVAVRRIGCHMLARKRPWPDGCAVEVVQHCADVMGLLSISKLRMAAGRANLIDLLLTGNNSKSSLKPRIIDDPRRSMA